MISIAKITTDVLRDCGWKLYHEGTRGLIWRHEDYPGTFSGTEARLMQWIAEYEKANYVDFADD